MNQKRQKLRIVAACCCFTGFVGTLVLWPLSHSFYVNGTYAPNTTTGTRIDLNIITGVVRVMVTKFDPTWNFVEFAPIVSAENYKQAFEQHNVTYRDIRPNNAWGISSTRTAGQVKIRCILAWPIVITGLLALYLKPPPRFRYSMRELFLLFTIAAITSSSLVVICQFANSQS